MFVAFFLNPKNMGLRRPLIIAAVVLAFYYYQFEIRGYENGIVKEPVKRKEIALHWMAPFFRFFEM